MVQQRETTRTCGDGKDRAELADGTDFVWRLAIGMGLSPQRADDVCFLTFQEALTAAHERGRGASRRPGWLLRAAVEQCAVARALSWADQRRGRSRRADKPVSS